MNYLIKCNTKTGSSPLLIKEGKVFYYFLGRNFSNNCLPGMKNVEYINSFKYL